MHVDTLILSLTWYCKTFFPVNSVEEIDLGLSAGDELFPEAHFFIQSFPDRQVLKNVIAHRDSGLIVTDNSKIILPYSEVSKSNSGTPCFIISSDLFTAV